MVETVNSDFAIQLRDKRAIVNDTLRKLLAQHIEVDDDVEKAIKYTLERRAKEYARLWCCGVAKLSGDIRSIAMLRLRRRPLKWCTLIRLFMMICRRWITMTSDEVGLPAIRLLMRLRLSLPVMRF